MLYQLLALREPCPIAAWGLPKPTAIELLPAESESGRAIRALYAAVRAYYPAEREVDRALEVLVGTAEFLPAARAEYERTAWE